MRRKFKYEGKTYDYRTLASMMDDEIRERLHLEMAPCTDQEFADRYMDEYIEKYGYEVFESFLDDALYLVEE